MVEGIGGVGDERIVGGRNVNEIEALIATVSERSIGFGNRHCRFSRSELNLGIFQL